MCGEFLVAETQVPDAHGAIQEEKHPRKPQIRSVLGCPLISNDMVGSGVSEVLPFDKAPDHTYQTNIQLSNLPMKPC